MTPFTIYLWQQADTLCSCLGTLAVLAGAASVVLCLVHLINVYNVGYYKGRGDRWAEELSSAEAVVAYTNKKWKWAIFATVVAALSGALMPSSKTIALMVALPAVANSDPIQKDLPELYKLAVEALKEQIAKPTK